MPLIIPTSEKPSDTAVTSHDASTDSTSAIAQSEDTGASSNSPAAQHTESEVEQAANKLYEERMEDEYAKREGGA